MNNYSKYISIYGLRNTTTLTSMLSPYLFERMVNYMFIRGDGRRHPKGILS